MERVAGILVAVLGMLGLVVAQPGGQPAAQAANAANPPQHTLSVSGDGIAMYPDFDPSIERYALTTTAAGVPAITVTARSSEIRSTVRINGAPAPNGTRRLTGVKPGDEISVLITDSVGTAVHSLFVTPPGFPTLQRPAVGTADADIAPGHVLLTMSTFTGGAGFFEAAVDDNGVPVFARASSNSMDFKRQPTGDLTISRATTAPGRTGNAVAVLDDQLREVTRYETVGLVDTDPHDSLLLDDGSRYLIAYEPNHDTGLTDSVIQHIAADGNVLWEWSTADHVDPVTESVVDPSRDPDYAHINSIEVMPDGDVLASFRHFSSVFKIARHPRAGVDDGDVVWKLGGRHSDFTFVDASGTPIPGDGGPCAQHTATVVDDGHILLFDNGSWAFDEASKLCVNPDDPAGDLVARPLSRVTEYALDVDAGTATPVWNYEETGRFAIFAGSARRLANGNTLIGWASSRVAVATEVSPTGQKVWELVDPAPDQTPRNFSYRVARTPIPDAIRPEVSVSGVSGSYAEGAKVSPAYACSDRGGSSLRSCVVNGLDGAVLDTRKPGSKQLRITATDGAGNTTTETRSFTVRKAPPRVARADAAIRAPGKAFRGKGRIGTAKGQTVRGAIKRRGAKKTFVVRLTNAGNTPSRYRLSGTSGNKRFKVSYRVAGRAHTRKVARGTYRTPQLRPGQSVRITMIVRRTAKARAGSRRTFKLRATSVASPGRRDVVAAIVRARGRG